jgi:predicted DNA binding protein
LYYVKYLDVRLRQPEWMMHPMQRFARNSDVVQYEELQAWNVLGSEFGVEHELFYVEAEREPYEEKLRTVDSIRWYDLTPIDEDAFYVFVCQETRTEDATWREAFAAQDLLVVPPVIYDDNGEFRITVVGESEDIQTMLDGLPDEIEVTVETIGEYDRRHTPVAGGLTDRQLEAISTAVDIGFYEVPRTASVEDVASELDCAASTAATLLRKAEASVIERVIDLHGRDIV